MLPPMNCGWSMSRTEKTMCTERQLQLLIFRTGPERKPALRRSDSEDFLYASDLPGLLSGEALEGFLHDLQEAGWSWKLTGDWLLMAPDPGNGEIRAERSPEAAAVVSLLERHPEHTDGDREWRTLVKACEQGGEKEKKAFRMLHGELAQALREHRKLPDLRIRWKDEDEC